MIGVVVFTNMIIATSTVGATFYMMKKGIDRMLDKPQPVTVIKFKEWTESKC